MDKIKIALKSIFKPKQVTYKQYTAAELNAITIKTRIVLEEIKKKLSGQLKQSDTKMKSIYNIRIQNKNKMNQYQTESNSVTLYQLMQEFSQKIIQIQSISILIELIKKIQASKANIIFKKGDISELKNEIRWFQAILWFRKCKNVLYTDQIHKFCFNYFKGIDITTELGVNCQLFKIYPVLENLNKKTNEIQVQKMFPTLKGAIDWDFDESVFKQIFKTAKKIPSLKNVSKSMVRINPQNQGKKQEFQPKQQPNYQNNPYINNQAMSSINPTQNKVPNYLKKPQFFQYQIKDKPEKMDIQDNRQIKQNFMKKQPFQFQNIPEQYQYKNNSSDNSIGNHSQQNNKPIMKDLQQINKNQQKQQKIIKKNHQYIADASSRMLRSNINDNLEENSDYIQNNRQQLNHDNFINNNHHQIEEKDQPNKQNLPNIHKKQPIFDNGDRMMRSQIDNNFTSGDCLLPSEDFRQQNQELKSLQQKNIDFEINDQEESLAIMRKHMVEQKKGVKKPYMVSVYARNQFINRNGN